MQGFSMGGYGAPRLGFKYNTFFGAVAALAGGPLQEEFLVDEGPVENKGLREKTLKYVYGDDQNYFKQLSPWVLAEQNVNALKQANMPIFQAVGDRDKTLTQNEDFHERLNSLVITHEFIIAPGVDHDALALFGAIETQYLGWMKKFLDAATVDQ
ncbi:MAG: hypothetical protein ACK53X_02335 [Holosporales bacterium]